MVNIQCNNICRRKTLDYYYYYYYRRRRKHETATGLRADLRDNIKPAAVYYNIIIVASARALRFTCATENLPTLLHTSGRELGRPVFVRQTRYRTSQSKRRLYYNIYYVYSCTCVPA